MKRINLFGLMLVAALLLASPVLAQNLVVNGSFENPGINTNNGDPFNNPLLSGSDALWNAFPSNFNEYFGWKVEWVNPDTALGYWGLPLNTNLVKDRPLLEIQRDKVYGTNAKADDGIQWAELDADWTGPFKSSIIVGGVTYTAPSPPYNGNAVPCSVSISQMLQTLPGDYTLSFAFGARPGRNAADNVLEVKLDGTVVDTLTKAGLSGSTINWANHTKPFTAYGPTELRFTDRGTSNSYGTLLDSVVVTRNGTGCTYTQGYWKTHSSYGPASYNETWKDKENAQFFTSGQTWYEMINTPPKKGNAYIILAHQYIAAYLNLLNNAAAADGLYAKMTAAEDLLNAEYNPDNKQAYIEVAEFLASYNEGYIGPGHCF